MMDGDKIFEAMTPWERRAFTLTLISLLIFGYLTLAYPERESTCLLPFVLSFFGLAGVLVKMLVRLHEEVGFMHGQNYERSREIARRMGWEE